MKLSEEQIKEILQHTQHDIEWDHQLEEAILYQINSPKQFEQDIRQSKRKAKISLWVSLATAFCLIVSLLYHLFTSLHQENSGLQYMMPSLMVIMVLFMLHQVLYFSQGLEKKVSTWLAQINSSG